MLSGTILCLTAVPLGQIVRELSHVNVSDHTLASIIRNT